VAASPSPNSDDCPLVARQSLQREIAPALLAVDLAPATQLLCREYPVPIELRIPLAARNAPPVAVHDPFVRELAAPVDRDSPAGGGIDLEESRDPARVRATAGQESPEAAARIDAAATRDEVVAAVLAQPSGSRPEMRDYFYENNMKGWGPELIKRRPEIKMETVDKFLTRMYRTNADFVFTVTRDFVRTCQTPVLILPDDIPAHPYAVAMEAAMLAPNAEVSMFPWKEPKERIPLAVRQVRSFLKAHRNAST